MYIPFLLSPNEGDIIERRCSHYDELIGIFMVITPRVPDRRDLVEVWCLYNAHIGVQFSAFKGLASGRRSYLHRENLMEKADARNMHRGDYYLIRENNPLTFS